MARRFALLFVMRLTHGVPRQIVAIFPSLNGLRPRPPRQEPHRRLLPRSPVAPASEWRSLWLIRRPAVLECGRNFGYGCRERERFAPFRLQPRSVFAASGAGERRLTTWRGEPCSPG